VAAASQEEMDKWLEDFRVAIANASWNAVKFESPLTNTPRGNWMDIVKTIAGGDLMFLEMQDFDFAQI